MVQQKMRAAANLNVLKNFQQQKSIIIFINFPSLIFMLVLIFYVFKIMVPQESTTISDCETKSLFVQFVTKIKNFFICFYFI